MKAAEGEAQFCCYPICDGPIFKHPFLFLCPCEVSVWHTSRRVICEGRNDLLLQILCHAQILNRNLNHDYLNYSNELVRLLPILKKTTKKTINIRCFTNVLNAFPSLFYIHGARLHFLFILRRIIFEVNLLCCRCVCKLDMQSQISSGWISKSRLSYTLFLISCSCPVSSACTTEADSPPSANHYVHVHPYKRARDTKQK